ncbi:unannotated protein [freshwater metagenome]|jgi:hypothetical protein|uniref:Unannotated protein n=1 Tax=freshwater metagenome TaxID=449393 RepID=A0A6J6G380_9ZZZZ
MSMWGLGKVVSRPPAEFEALDDTTNNFKGVADKVIKWVPGDILALYAAGVVAFDATKPRWWLGVIAVMFAPVFLRLGVYAVDGSWGKKEKLAAGLAVPATALWIGSVPGNGWLRWKLVADNPKPAAFVFLAAAAVFSMIADGKVKKMEKTPQPAPTV